jgi:hypothetical protein
VDGLGRRNEIDTSQMGELAYQRLLEAASHPLRLDDLDAELTTFSEAPQALREGGEPGRETGLLLPDWWEVPKDSGAPADELKAMIRRNLERATQHGKGIFKPWPR